MEMAEDAKFYSKTRFNIPTTTTTTYVVFSYFRSSSSELYRQQ